MDKELVQKLKQDLAIAVKEKNTEKINLIRQMLNISDEQAKYFDRGLTGYPSIDKVWNQYYPKGQEEKVNNIPVGKTIWDVIEEKLLEYYDIPAIEYYKKVISRPEFRKLCYTWARTFRAMGVQENEMVPVYGPFVPEVCAMLFALNMIGAHPYFLKLAIGPKALAEETADSKIAIVYEDMWPLVAHEFSKDKYKNVIISTARDDMPSPLKEVVALKNKLESLKRKSKIPNDKKYIWIDKAIDISNYYSGEVKVPFKPNRRAIITSSSGSTGGVKGTVATNESVLTQIFSTIYSDILYKPGLRTLNHFPPTAATSLNALFMVALMSGATVVMDPRISDEDFYNQLMFLKPNICINTEPKWKMFFRKLSKEIEKQEHEIDLSYAIGWMVGGQGASADEMREWDQILEMCGGRRLIGGYGLSEAFSGISYDRIDMPADYSKAVMNSGLIQVGMTAGIFDKSGMELPYNKRGELKVKTNAVMEGYFNKPELTAKSVVDGWIQTGDLAEINDKGFLFAWGRMIDSIQLSDGNVLYLFDVANKIKENEYIDDALVLLMPTEDNKNNLVSHIVWKQGVTKEVKNNIIRKITAMLKEYLPFEVTLNSFAEHEEILPYSQSTLKTDFPGLAKQLTGYIKVSDENIKEVEYVVGNNGYYILQEPTEMNKVKTRTNKKNRK